MIVLLVLVGRAALAAEGAPPGKDTGVGIIVGQPTGLSAKFVLSSNIALDAAVGWRFGSENGLRLHLDVLAHHTIARGASVAVPLFVGLGPALLLHKDEVGLALRIPVGIALVFRSVPIDVFVELAPSVGLYPGSTFFLTLAAGARFWF